MVGAPGTTDLLWSLFFFGRGGGAMYRVGMHIYSTNYLTTKGGNILARGGGQHSGKGGQHSGKGGTTFWQRGVNALPVPPNETPDKGHVPAYRVYYSVCIP